MIEMRLSEAATVLHANFTGTDAPFQGCSTDSRTLPAGALFFALRGERFDGHGFLADVARRGARGAVVEQTDGAGTLPLLLVADTRAALGRLAGAWRQRFQLPFVAVTGSNGKTTVKEMVAAILATQAPTLVTAGNLNNDIGVPLTLFGLDAGHRYGVVEMGANHPGEIAALVRLVQPDVAVITQCAPAHLEGFGSVEGVARAKAEIYGGVRPGGTAVINADDDFADHWRGVCKGMRQVSFGIAPGADVAATDIRNAGTAMNFTLVAGVERAAVRLPLLGRHNVMNALAAAACARALDVPLARIVAGLAAMHAVKGRLQLKAARNGAQVIDDTYNANPASLDAALAVLAEFPGRRWLVLGDMGELGPGGPELHARAGESARRAGVERLFAVGPLSKRTSREFGAGARHFARTEDLVVDIAPALAPDVTVLVKGSRSMAMERVVNALLPGN